MTLVDGWVTPGQSATFEHNAATIIIIMTILQDPETSILGGCNPQILSKGVVDGSWNIIISYHVQEVCWKWWLLKRNRIICLEVAVNGQFLPGNSNFFLKLSEKTEPFGNLPGKIEIFLTRFHDPPDFKPDWRRCQDLTN